MGNFMQPELHVVVGHPYSDIGKGWITSSVAAQLGSETPVLKIDPMLSPAFPHELGVVMDGAVVTDDVNTYTARGLSFKPERNIVIGGWMAEALGCAALSAGRLGSEAPKITYADLEKRLASTMNDLIGEGNTGVIEIGGCPDDQEAYLPAAAVRAMSHSRRVMLHLVTAFDYSSFNDGRIEAKTRPPVRAIESTMKTYWGTPLDALRVYVRRANVPTKISDEILKNAMNKIAFKTQLDPNQVTFVPNVSSPEELDEYVKLPDQV